MDDKLYTAGEIARLSGVSIRTIRFYDAKGVLKPYKYSESGHRLYNRDSVKELQKILMLKFLGFSLESITIMMKSEDNKELKNSLEKQKKLLISKKEHISRIIEGVDDVLKSPEDKNWDKIINVINLIVAKEDIVNQYDSDKNLKDRINLHDLYSINKYGWHKWVFDMLNIKPNMRILEIGCGSGELWYKNKDRIPENVEIILSDYSSSMIEKCRSNINHDKDIYKGKNINFKFERIDCENFKISEQQIKLSKKFDIVVANHMLYFVNNRAGLFKNIRDILKDQGMFFCSTVGNNHMGELFDLAQEFDKSIKLPTNAYDSFSLENGKKQLVKYFSYVTEKDYEDGLIVDDADALYDYLYSIWGNIKKVIDNSNKSLKSFIEKKLKKGPMHITKNTGLFICKK